MDKKVCVSIVKDGPKTMNVAVGNIKKEIEDTEESVSFLECEINLKQEMPDQGYTESWCNLYDTSYVVCKEEVWDNCLDMSTHSQAEANKPAECTQTLEHSLVKTSTSSGNKQGNGTRQSRDISNISTDENKMGIKINDKFELKIVVDIDNVKPDITNVSDECMDLDMKLTCDMCDYEASSKADIESHSVIHSCKVEENKQHIGEKLFSCDICYYKFRQKCHLVRHMMTHTGEKPFSCNICFCKFRQKDHLASHMKTHTGEKNFSCNYCKYKCGRKAHLVSHIRSHTGEKPFSCNLCNYKCGRKSHLIGHMRTHTGEKPFSCNLCSYKCGHKSHLVSHMRTHTGEKPFSCSLCGYECGRKSCLVRHRKTHSSYNPENETVKLEVTSNQSGSLTFNTSTDENNTGIERNDKFEQKAVLKNELISRDVRPKTEPNRSLKRTKSCGDSGNDIEMLNQRANVIKSDIEADDFKPDITNIRGYCRDLDKKSTCDLRDYEACSKADKESHTVIHSCKVVDENTHVSHKNSLNVHTAAGKQFSCNLCSYESRFKSNLARHMRHHTGEKPFSCSLCSYKCVHKSKLVGHLKTHSGEKPFFCNLCSYQCERKTELVSHTRSHVDKKPVSCSLCSFSCWHKSHLVCHMRTHTGEKPFSCTSCSYKCSRKSHLVAHMRTHTGEKPYSCSLCSYKCKHKSHLDSHMMTHTGEKPFSCNLCSYKSGRKFYLVRHMRTHVKEVNS